MINTLKKLLEDTKEEELRNYLLLYNSIENIKEDLDNITFESKESTYSNIMELIELYKIYYIFPELVEKNICGVSCFDFKLKDRFYKEFLGIDNIKALKLFCDKLILPSNIDEITALNYLDKKINLSNKEIDFLFKNRDINLSEIINVLKIDTTKLDYNNIAFFDVLEDRFMSNPINLEYLDSLVILSYKKDEISKKLELLKRDNYDGQVIIYSQLNIDNIIDKFSFPIEVCNSFEELKEKFESMVEKSDKFKNLLLKIKIIFEKAFLELKVNKENLISRKNNIEKILIFEKNKELMNLSFDYQGKIELNNKSNKKLNELYLNTINSINNLILIPSEEPAKLKYKYELGKILVKLEKANKVEEVILDLESSKYEKSVFLKYLNEGKSEKYYNQVLKLNHFHDLYLLLEKIKIQYKKEKNSIELQEYIKSIDLKMLEEFSDGEVCEIMGNILLKSNRIRSIDFYRKGLDFGNTKCGEQLYAIYEEDHELNERNLVYLSKNNIEKACLKLGYYYLDKKKFGQAVFEFKKGAILGSDESFYTLGEIHDKNSKLALFFYYQIKDRKKYWDNSVKERITKYFYYEKDVSQLSDFYKESKFPLAAFFLGILYEKGEVVEKDENRALEFYKASDSLPQGLKNYTRLNSYITKRNNRSYSSSYSSSYHSYSSKSSSWCFITTAVCDTLGKSDNCLELTIFRNFRDNWLVFQPEGEKDIKEYYRIAPEIVSNINLLENRNEIYRMIWEKHLNYCFFLIRNKEFEKARRVYKEMVLELSKEFFEE